MSRRLTRRVNGPDLSQSSASTASEKAKDLDPGKTMLNDCICHSGTPVKDCCHPEDPGWKRCFQKEETTVYHIFNSMNVETLESVPWDFIKSHYILDDSEIRLCKTIVQEELDMGQKLSL